MPIPKTKDLNGVREFFTNLKTQFASAAATQEGPIKSLFDEVTGKLQSVLAGLPLNVESEPDWLFDSLSSTTNLVSLLSLELSRVRTAASVTDTLSAALAAGTHLSKADHEAGVKAAVATAIAERTGDKGDLVTKTTVDQLCSAAKDLGIKEGRASLQSELDARLAGDKLASDRTAALTAAGIPLPESEVAAVLRASEDHFVAARTTVETRLKAFTEAGLELPSDLLANCWLPESDFKKFQKTVTSIPALKVRGGAVAAEPFASPPVGGGSGSGATARMLG